MTITRSVAFPVKGHWITEMITEEGRECSADGVAIYGWAEGSVRHFDQWPQMLIDCLDGDWPIAGIEKHQPYIMGILPMRWSRTPSTIEPQID
jgi:hypothetical protein